MAREGHIAAHCRAMKTYETDVLVVGGGGAATASTIAAHDAGARTMMAVKGQFGVPGVRGAGATSNPKADFWTIRTVGPKGGLFNGSTYLGIVGSSRQATSNGTWGQSRRQ